MQKKKKAIALSRVFYESISCLCHAIVNTLSSEHHEADQQYYAPFACLMQTYYTTKGDMWVRVILQIIETFCCSLGPYNPLH